MTSVISEVCVICVICEVSEVCEVPIMTQIYKSRVDENAGAAGKLSDGARVRATGVPG